MQLPFERLAGRENYANWKIGAKAHLITKGVFDHFLKALSDCADQKEKSGNQKALYELTLLIDSNIYSYLEGCEIAKDAWDMLVKTFEDKGTVRKVGLLKQWISLKLEECSSMQEYFSKCLALRAKVKAVGYNIHEHSAGSIWLQNI